MADMALSGLRWAASPVVNKLLADASTYLGFDMAREIQDLETTILPQFDLVIEAAEKSPHKGKLEAWLRKLKDAFYTAEELLDEHEYNQLKIKAKNGKDFSVEVDTSSVKEKILKPLRAATSKVSNLLPENRKLIRQLKELKDILGEAKDFRQLLGIPACTSAPGLVVATTMVPPATSLPPPRVFGRDADRDRVIDLLTNKSAAEGSSSSYSGVAIVGHGGAGKSTLAQHIYNDDRVKEHFDVRMWVCISRRIDVHRHTRSIIESAMGSCPPIDNLDTLQCQLRDILNSKKFLLVLDDVWFDESNNETEWDKLLDPLVSQQAGSKVLVTSRRDVLPASLCCEVIRMENMDDADFLALFKHHAFSGADVGCQRVQLQLEEIAEKIAKRLGHSPLAAKVLGSQLSRKKYINAWKDALRINNLSEPMRALLWSYEKLDPRLQRCFLYCSLFPKGYSYRIDELIDLWVAEGLVDASNHNRTMEDIGFDYFNELLSGSFFQLVSERFVMHDLLHDLAESLSSGDCFRLEEDNVADIPCTVRHLSIGVKSMKKHKQMICKLHHLRTVICIAPVMDDASDIFDEILKNLKKLRILYLSFYNSNMLPESVGELKHLRYLNITKTFISELPISLCYLYHLQLLQLNHKVKRLPDKLCNLSKLRYLEGYDVGMQIISETPVPQIPNIGKLTSLQKLHEFSIQRNKGYELGQLRDMNELGGSLRVMNLENVTGKDEALESNLHKKSHLKKLHLVWSCENDKNEDDSLHLDTLEGLKPSPQLNAIIIEGYKSATYPSWLLEGSYLENLERFGLVNCSLLEVLPSDTNLFRYCDEMVLDNVPNLKTLYFIPAGLESLSIARCQRLMFITEDELQQHDKRDREHMMNRDNLASRLALLWEVDSRSYIREALSGEHSSLEQLMTSMDDDISKHLQTIKHALEGDDKVLVKEDVINAWLCCHEQRIRLVNRSSMGLQPVWPSGLRRLNLHSCSITDGALSTCLGSLTSLRDLSLHQIMNLNALPSEEVFQHLTTLGFLEIQFCWCLRSLGGLRAAASLWKLKLAFCPSLALERGSEFMPVSLEILSIFSCVLAADFFCTDLPNLKQLDLSSCRSSDVLPVGRLTSLQSLALLNLTDLCILEGLSSLQLHHAHLLDVPKLAAECISECRVQESLHVSSSVLLNNMVSAEGVTVPLSLSLQGCTEPSVSFKKSVNFSSVRCLTFRRCSMNSLPENMEYFSSLEDLEIDECPNISSLPDLPPSVQSICICDCELLKESCRAPDGESWSKIAYIRWKDIR